MKKYSLLIVIRGVYMIKRLLSFLIAVTMVITSAPIVWAADDDYNGGQGGNTGNISDGGFSLHNQGLRVSLYDGTEPLAELGENAIVDVWYNAKPSGAIMLEDGNNKRGVPTSSQDKEHLYDEAGFDKMPMPLNYDDASKTFIAQGDLIREFLLGKGAYVGQITGAGGAGGVSTGTPITGFGNSAGSGASPSVYEQFQSAVSAAEREAAVNSLILKNNSYLKFMADKEREKFSIGQAATPQQLEIKLQSMRQVLIQEAQTDFSFTKEESDKLISEMDTAIDKIVKDYAIDYNIAGVGTTKVLGSYKVNPMYTSIEDEPIPLDGSTTSSVDGGEKMSQFLKACYSNVISGEQLAAILNSKPDIRVLIEPLAAYNPRGLDGTYYDLCYGTPTNMAHQNIEKQDVLGNDKGALMCLLTNMASPNSMVLAEDDLVLGISKPSSATFVPSAILAGDDIGWGLHIYSKLDTSGTSTWDEVKYPDGTPGPAPESIPEGSTEAERALQEESLIGTIVKFYEEESEPVSNFVRDHTETTVVIEDEPMYTLSEWFISPNKVLPSSQSTKYSDTKSSCTVVKEGSSPETVSIAAPNTTLYLLLVKSSEEETVLQDFRLNESELTRAFNNSTVYGQPGWDYSHLWKWVGQSLEPHRSNYFAFRIADSSLKFFVELTHLVGQSVAGKNTGVFAPNDISGVAKTRTDKYGTSPFDVKNLLHFVVYRFKDKPTLAEFKTSKAVENTLKPLFPYIGNVPKGIDRYNDGRSYMDNINMTIGQSGKSDVRTTATYKYKVWKSSKNGGGHWVTRTGSTSSTHSTNPFSFSGVLQTLVYHRLPGMTKTGQVTNSDILYYNTMTGTGKNTEHTRGFMKQTAPLIFYPYVRMTYQQTGQYKVKNDAYVLSESKSVIIPNDYVEAGWVTKNEEESLHMYSQQWSIHAKATRPTNDGAGSGAIVRPWAGKNQVLPGGAMYDLATDETDSTVTIGTWQTVIPDVACNGNSVTQRELFTQQGTDFGDSGTDSYTVKSALDEHEILIKDARKSLDALKVVQWVNTDTQADKAWSKVRGSCLKVFSTTNGISLSKLNLGNWTKTDSKYYLKEDPTGNSSKIDEGDIDILKTYSMAVVYKASADTSGNFYLQKANVYGKKGYEQVPEEDINSAIEKLAKQVPDSGDKVLSKTQSVKSLDPFAVELEQKTKIFSNLEKALERNTGGDSSASWAPDGGWYNEAMDGIFIVRQITSYDIGFETPDHRTAVLDPNLCPRNLGIADLFSKAHLSQFRLDNKSDAFKNEPEYFIGKFKGRVVEMADMENILQSRKFYIPNVNVQDLLGIS